VLLVLRSSYFRSLFHPAIPAATAIGAVVFSLVTRRRLGAATLITIRLTIYVFERGILFLIAPAMICRMNSFSRLCARSSLAILVSHTCSHR
jgi:hypothetical protein